MVTEEEEIQALLSEPDPLDELPEVSDDLSFIYDLIKSSEVKIELSPEDVLWADSCFAFDSQTADEDWQALSESLLDALSIENQPSTGSDHMETEGTKPEEFHVAEVLKVHQDHAESQIVKDLEMEQFQGDQAEAEAEDTRSSDVGIRLVVADVEGEYPLTQEHAGEPVSPESVEAVESHESIFRTWELDTSFADEEDELIRNLQKLLKTSSFNSSFADEPDHAVDNVHELVASMGGLSLYPEK